MSEDMEMKRSLRVITHRLNLNKDSVLRFLVFALFAGLTFAASTVFGQSFSNFGKTLSLTALSILVLVTWIMAGHAVVKSLFFVGASLSLVIYLAQAYCEVPAASRTVVSDQALQTLLIFSLVYIGFDFLRSLLKEAKERSKTLKEMNKGKKPWFILIPFGLFTGLFVAEVYFVLLPIIKNLCVYK